MRSAGLTIFSAVALAGCANGGANDVPQQASPTETPSAIHASPSLSPDAEREHAVDQLVGRWVYQVCDEDGSCETVVRIYEEAEEDGLVRYTELYDGTSNEGFVGYDVGRDGFVEFDYPANWSGEEFEHRYRSEDTAIRLFGETPFAGPEDRVLQWHMNEDGSTMILSTGVGDVSAPPREFLNVIFSRVPLIGDNEDNN